MKDGKVTLVNGLGLHARAAAKLVHLAKTFSSEVQLGKEGRFVDGKSIMSVLLLEAPLGTMLDLRVEGEDEAEAFAAIVQLVGDRFGEDE